MIVLRISTYEQCACVSACNVWECKVSIVSCIDGHCFYNMAIVK